ncbi:MAG: hypothetical protein J0I79_16420 [Mesorhizobium sp.]|uniref:hypothetical protein n=1 Tax=Mesorhizobium sp. TaxID=1871066 RepID=UPI001ACAEE3A|nr:hypothetical protein [Mesorhizobium sp.]MBN9219531.1 hypothetical protein [Mesorhizobium sp.]
MGWPDVVGLVVQLFENIVAFFAGRKSVQSAQTLNALRKAQRADDAARAVDAADDAGLQRLSDKWK